MAVPGCRHLGEQDVSFDFDLYLYRKAQRATDLLQEWTGYTNFAVVRAANFGTVAMPLLWGIGAFLAKTAPLAVMMFGGLFLLSAAIILTFASPLLDKMEDYYADPSITAAHPLSLYWFHQWYFRAFELGLVLVMLPCGVFVEPTWAGKIGWCLVISMPIGSYFKICIPKPPGRSKVQQFFESMRMMLHPVKE